MSASQQKKTRSQSDETLSKRQAAKAAELAKAKKEKKNITIITVCFAIFAALVIFLNSSLFYRVLPAVKVGDVSYSVSDYSFFYRSQYLGLVNGYASFYDQTQPLSVQQCMFDSTKTWEEYFQDAARESAEASLKSVTMLYTEATNAGFTISDEDRQAYEETLESYKNSHVGTDFTSADKYVSAAYGKGLNISRIAKLLEMSFVATAYEEYLYDTYMFTAEELAANYEENKDNYDSYSFLYYFVSGAPAPAAEGEERTEEQTAALKEEAMAMAKATAESIVANAVVGEPESVEDDDNAENAENVDEAESETDSAVGELESVVDAPFAAEDAFLNSVYEETGAVANNNYTQGSGLGAEYADWLKASSRTFGDMEVIEGASGYHVLFFMRRDENTYETVKIRHILIKAVADADGNYTDEAKDAASARAEELLAEWKAGDATEDSFAELANLYSEDPGSNTTGGFYEKFAKHAMVPEFDSWVYDSARKEGDTGIVLNDSTVGYHVIYFAGYGPVMRDTLADEALRTKAHEDWTTAETEKYSFETAFGFKLVQ